MDSILIVEDDPGLQEFLKEVLANHGYSVKGAKDGTAALSLIGNTPPDLVLLDLGLPDISGETVCQEIKKKHPNLPVVMLTARDNVTDVVHGLNVGADDYIAKPFVADELVARIAARLRPSKGGNVLKVDDLQMDTENLKVTREGKTINLTPLEFNLLKYLMLNQGRVLTREMILDRVWAYSAYIETRLVDVYVGYLRKKIDKPFKNKLIHSVRGFGYQIKDSSLNN